MIIDIIVILNCYLIFYKIYNEGVRIRYPCSNTDAQCYNTDALYTIRIYYILLMNQSDKLKLHYL